MKKKIALISMLSLLFMLQHIKAQDVYSRLQQASKQGSIIRKEGRPAQIASTDPHWKINRRTPIPFIPFPMVDRSGKAIKPTDFVTLRDGSKMIAADYFKKYDEIEKNANALGYSLRNHESVTIAQFVTDNRFLDGKANTIAPPIRPLRSSEERKKSLDLHVNVGGVVLKPVSSYTVEEKKQLEGVEFVGSGAAANITVKKSSGNATLPKPVALPSGQTPLKTINETETKDFSFGDPKVVSAGIKGTLTRHAIIYPFDAAHPDKCLSEYRITASGAAYTSVLGEEFDVLSGNADFFAPTNPSKQMTASIAINVCGVSIYNESGSCPQQKKWSQFEGRSFSLSKALSIPLVPALGIEFTGSAGVSGSVGLDINATLSRDIVMAQVQPVAKLSALLEGKISFGPLGGGIRSNMDLITANMDLQGLIWVGLQDPRSVSIVYQHYFGYDVKMLDGQIILFVDACVPIINDCTDIWTYPLFSWGGFHGSGTISEDQQTIILKNSL